MRTLASTFALRLVALPVLALLLLVGCTASEKPETKKSPKSSTPAKPATPAPPVAEPLPPEPIRTDAPTPTPQLGEWWCLCHQTETDAGPQATTSCRELESECRDLEKRVAQGGRGVVAGSLSASCRAVTGDHPGDALGGREVWSPSKRAGAWTSEGSCLLDAAAEPEGDAAFDSLLATEAFGELRLGMTVTEVQDLLGVPQAKGEIEEWEATGEFYQEWDYADVGLVLQMSAVTRRAAQSLYSIRAKSPSTLQTKRGIGIGSDWAAVDKAYGDVHDKEGMDPADKSSFTAGSVYGGVFFSFEAGKVDEIFMGAGAE